MEIYVLIMVRRNTARLQKKHIYQMCSVELYTESSWRKYCVIIYCTYSFLNRYTIHYVLTQKLPLKNAINTFFKYTNIEVTIVMKIKYQCNRGNGWDITTLDTHKLCYVIKIFFVYKQYVALETCLSQTRMSVDRNHFFAFCFA